jgi:hypothetical protein
MSETGTMSAAAATGDGDGFTAADDGLHAPSGNFYETETFWFSFFVPERALGAWLYASVRQNAGVTAGGLWIWDDAGPNPWDAPFYENFSHLKPPTDKGSGRLEFPTGMSIDVREPGMSYGVGYDDRDRVRVDLGFEALERPVPLRSGAPPYPKASHYDQTGRVTGAVVLDGERIDVDCYAMRDRSWGPRTERGYQRVGYTWAAGSETSLLTFTTPGNEAEEAVHSGYVRRDGELAQIAGGTRVVRRDPAEGWVTGIDVEVVDELGRTTRGHAEAVSRLVLPGSTTVCTNTALRWTVDGQDLHGEDQDVWPLRELRSLRRA